MSRQTITGEWVTLMWYLSEELGTEPSVGAKIRASEIYALIKLLLSGRTLNRGEEVNQFETLLANKVKVARAISTTSCSAALYLVPKLLQLRRGDEVLVPANAFWTAISPLLERGVKIVPYEVHKQDLNGSIDDASIKFSKKTRAIYVQSFGGSPYDAVAFRSFCDEKGIYLVEDSAHAIGSTLLSEPIQSYADLSCMSFSTLKNLVTLGEGGAITTKNIELGEKAAKLIESRVLGTGSDITIEESAITSLKNFNEIDNLALFRVGDSLSWNWNEIHEFGLTLRMSAPAALIGRLQLLRLEETLARREIQRNYYKDRLLNCNNKDNFVVGTDFGSSNHLMNLYIEDPLVRRRILLNLKQVGHYKPVLRYVPITFQSVPRYYGLQPGMTPVYEDIFFNHLVSLPIGPRVSRSNQDVLIDCLNLALNA